MPKISPTYPRGFAYITDTFWLHIKFLILRLEIAELLPIPEDKRIMIILRWIVMTALE